MYAPFRTASVLTIHHLHNYSEDLTNPVAAIPPIDAGLIKLYDDIRTTVDQEAEIISMVFPNPAAVFQVFIQRVFEQSVSVSFILHSLDAIWYSLDINTTIPPPCTRPIDSTIHRDTFGEIAGEIDACLPSNPFIDP